MYLEVLHSNVLLVSAISLCDYVCVVNSLFFSNVVLFLMTLIFRGLIEIKKFERLT